MALDHLRVQVELNAISAVYETEPVGYLAQPAFLNLVCRGSTQLSVDELLLATKSIERELGRRPSFRNAPRPIDIDILFYDSVCMESEHLTIPHPRFSERAFVLVPLAEIAPTFSDPRTGKSMQELLAEVSVTGVVKTNIILDKEISKE